MKLSLCVRARDVYHPVCLYEDGHTGKLYGNISFHFAINSIIAMPSNQVHRFRIMVQRDNLTELNFYGKTNIQIGYLSQEDIKFLRSASC